MATVDSIGRLFLQTLESNDVLLLFTLIGAGCLLGRIRVVGVSLGSVAGVVICGLPLGQFGLRVAPSVEAVGFALFIFSVGYEAGPRVFSALREDGLRYLALSLVVAVSALGLAATLANLLGTEPGVSAGLLAGSMTSPPALAAAQDAARHYAEQAQWSHQAVIDNIATACALTYISGSVVLLLLVRYLPTFLRIDLVAEAGNLAWGKGEAPDSIAVTTRCYRVENIAFTLEPLAVLRERYCPAAPMLRVIRQGEPLVTGPGTCLQLGDRLELSGPGEIFAGGVHEIGPEIIPSQTHEGEPDTARVFISQRTLIGHSLDELDLSVRFGIFVTQVTRGGLHLPRDPHLRLRRGDIVTVIGPRPALGRFVEFAGLVETDISETDMLTLAVGIAAGMLAGTLAVAVGGSTTGPASVAGLLLAGLLAGYLRNIGPTFVGLAESTRWPLMELGLLLFMAGVGLRAGGDVVETLRCGGLLLILASVVVTTVTPLLAWWFGSRILKLNPAILLGALSGAMTSRAALQVAARKTGNDLPAVGYAATCAIGNVLLMVCGPLVLLLA